jgi:predicted nucleic acid-binding protein
MLRRGQREADMSPSKPADTIETLRKYAKAAEAGGLPSDVAVKVQRMRELMDEVEWLQDVDAEEDTVANVLDEAARLAAEIQRQLTRSPPL